MAFTPKTKMIAKNTGVITSKFAAPEDYVQPDVAPPVVASAAPITTAPTIKRDIRTSIPGFSAAPSNSKPVISNELAFAIGAGGAALTNYLKKSAALDYGKEDPANYTSALVPGSMQPGGSMSGPATGPGGAPAGSGAPGTPGTPGTPGAAPSGSSDVDKLANQLKNAIVAGATAAGVKAIFDSFGIAKPAGNTPQEMASNWATNKVQTGIKTAANSAVDWLKDLVKPTPSAGGDGTAMGDTSGPTPEGGPDITGLPDKGGAPYNPGDQGAGGTGGSSASGIAPNLNTKDTGTPGFFGPGGPGSASVEDGAIGKDGVPTDEGAKEVLQQPSITALGDGYFYDETTDQVFKVANGQLVDATQEFASILDASPDQLNNWNSDGIDFAGDSTSDTIDAGDNTDTGSTDYASNDVVDSGGDEYGAKGGLFTLKKGKHMATGGIAHMAGGGVPASSEFPPGSITYPYDDGSSVTYDSEGLILQVIDNEGNNVTQETINRVAAKETGTPPQASLTPGYVSDAEQIARMNARSVYTPAEDPRNHDTGTGGSSVNTPGMAPVTSPTGTPATPATPGTPAGTPDPQANSFLARIRNILGNEYVQGGITATMLAQLLNGAEDKGNKGVNVADYGIQGGRTTDFGMGAARKVSLGAATKLAPAQQNEIYANLGVPGYTAQTENTTAPAKAPATAAHGGSIHYTYGTHIDPHEMLGIPKRGGGLASIHQPSPPPMIQGRHDYRQGAYVQGAGDGQSDDIPAMLADGEYVIDAELVSMLGNGSNKAGAKVLDNFRKEVRAHKRSAPLGKIPPKTKSPLEYLKGA
jgi:hypothetical protein